jgi:hypothetical protein
MFKKFLLGGGRFAGGILMKKSMEWVFDYGLYPFTLVYLGYLWGGIAMVVLATIINYYIIKAYDWAEVDWLFIEEIKKIRDGEDVKLTGILKWLKPLLKKGDVLAFFVLCADDPVTAVLYLRKGSHLYNGLNGREWRIFWAANIVANLYWIGAIAVALESSTYWLRPLVKGVESLVQWVGPFIPSFELFQHFT